MATTVGGSIISVSLDGRLFAVTADADAKRSLGGFENEVEADGNGDARLIKTRMPWEVGGLTLSINEQRRDQQFLETAKAKLDWFPITITFASGYTYRGKGQITDKLEFNSKNSTAEISLKGPANFEQQ